MMACIQLNVPQLQTGTCTRRHGEPRGLFGSSQPALCVTTRHFRNCVSTLSMHGRSCSSGNAMFTSIASQSQHRPRGSARVHSMGKDAMGGWLDLTKLVTGGGSSKTAYDELAFAIGRDVYVDIAGWHLYMRDMSAIPGLKMNQALANQLGPQLGGRSRMDETDIATMLRKIPVKLGSGKLQVSLYDVMPSMCVGDLAKICEDYARSK